jgi:hypothetical protein
MVDNTKSKCHHKTRRDATPCHCPHLTGRCSHRSCVKDVVHFSTCFECGGVNEEKRFENIKSRPELDCNGWCDIHCTSCIPTFHILRESRFGRRAYREVKQLLNFYSCTLPSRRCENVFNNFPRRDVYRCFIHEKASPTFNFPAKLHQRE